MKIGTRSSLLALAQTEIVITELIKLAGMKRSTIEIVQVTTTGDKLKDRDLSLVGGKGLFIKELEEQLLLGNIDIAIHSNKDIPATIPDGLEIMAYLERDLVEDVFIAKSYKTLEALPAGSKIGTSSPRRKIQILQTRSDLEIVLLRGNVQTRLEKVVQGEVDATILAQCGLKRLGINAETLGLHCTILPKNQFIPAAGQGIICVEGRKEDNKIKNIVSKINHHKTAILINAERGFVERLNGTCKTPMAAYAELDGDNIVLNCMLSNQDCSQTKLITEIGSIDNPYALGQKAADKIIQFFI